MELTLQNITKKYERVLVLNDISLTLKPGIYGLLGANGAGKTTLFRIICRLMEPTHGSIKFNGKNVNQQAEAYRTNLGFLPQDFSYYPDFTGMRFMLYIAALKGLNNTVAKKRSLELLKQVGLEEMKDIKIRKYSGGMKQRLGIAQALLHDPQILIVDEPTAGLDPEERIRFRNMLSEFAEDRIVILSTHISSDVETSCENIGVLDNGKMIWNGAAEELIKQAEGKVYLISAEKKQDKIIREKYTVLNIIASGSGTQYRVLSETLPEEKHILQAPTLEDGYMYLLSQTDGGINNEIISKRM